MNLAVECAERGDYKGFWEACEMFSEDWLTIYWKATCLSLGFGCEQDTAQGNRLATEILPSVLTLAEKGDAVAQHKLGVLYDHGWGVEKDAVHAVEWYRKAAEQGQVNAQYNLARMYENGRGVGKDDGQAVVWYRKAAEHGHVWAQCNLGRIYRNGRGVEKDDVQAVAWYRKAAEQGYPRAQRNLGWMYENGHGVEKDDEQAVEWYRKAAEQGDAYAQNGLGGMYLDGRGVEKDDEQAVVWYRKAAEQGNEDARKILDLKEQLQCAEGKLAEVEKELKELVGDIAELGAPEAQYSLGLMYENGRGVEKDASQAVTWYRKAAGQGHDRAQVNLGLMYWDGRGVERDEAQAMAWYRKAAEQGNEDARKILDLTEQLLRAAEDFAEVEKEWKDFVGDVVLKAESGDPVAQYSLGRMYENGHGVERDELQAVAWYRKALMKLFGEERI